MSGYSSGGPGGFEDSVPAYLTIRVTPLNGPIAAFAEQEAWQARERYPRVMGVGAPEFFWAREHDAGGWELSEFGADAPQQARDSLGSHFRMRSQAAEQEDDAGAARQWMAAALRMDREVVDELEVRGERFRIVRASHFVRMGPSGPEPPRPSDPDPGEVGDGDRAHRGTQGFVVDPFTGTGLSDGLLKLDLMRFVGVVRGAPPEVSRDARRAAEEYPGGVLLPAVFALSERVDGEWRSHHPGVTYATPQGARDGLASWLRVMAPFSMRLDDEERAVYAAAADRLDDKRANVATVAGRRFRVTRVERMVRIGPDGPEGPRPSDFDPEPPIEVHVRQLKAAGEWKDEDEPLELDARTLELKALWEQEEARRAAAIEKRDREREERRERGPDA
ncbi:DUF5954 family protein [Streptomyces sp. PTM05]|uniref:DUF5954 family protein n=1 Tax=Streptantibioticus parmotrematis TaxID=2873249 RepID=A0ABS7QTK4_9ACTN|nr:DUF5954 family protein [Streptantibioticus parmotrematis]MBY8886528.1 DUF5954 family protein [Streptantibioticus parmotrematis]